MDDLTELYCLVDDFCQAFKPPFKARLLADGQRHRSRRGGLSLAEFMTRGCSSISFVTGSSSLFI